NGAFRVAESLRRAFERETWEYKGEDLGKVTISLGVSQYSGQDAEILYKDADRALYAAKKGGRNRVAMASLV
ncbi:MAG: diguanylate cyclase, partial [Nanoarchaeota archaeon]|nr:diguanylate cyclase [Nanoarchaeota archaeon]